MIFEVTPGVDAVADPLNRKRWGGMGYLAGSLPVGENDGRAKVLNVPAAVQIAVLDPLTYEVVARATSKVDGTWRVLYLDPGQRFTVIAADWNMTVNSAIQDWVQPSPMEP